MSPTSGQRARRPYGPGRADYVNPGLRVSDAERTEVADRLSANYSDGRLDQAEFDRRLDLAMKATTRADLDALFADLPGGAPSGPDQPQPIGPGRPPRRRYGLGFIIAVIAIVAILSHGLAHFFVVPWLLIAVLAFIWLRRVDARRRY